MRPMQIDQLVAEIFQHGQRGGRAVDELAVGARRREAALQNQLAADYLDASIAQLQIEFFQLRSFENCFHRADIRAGANQRFVRAFAEQQLESADDDRLARAGFAGDRGKARRELPLEVLDERQVFYSQERDDSGHRESLKVEG